MTLVSDALRRAVVDRAGGRCEYCQLAQQSQVATFPVDHVSPVSAGGRTHLDNLALACPRCNAAKWTHTADIDPVSGELTRLFDPRSDTWSDHFQWSIDNPSSLEPRSAIGRATVQLLQLNSEHRHQVRRWLIALGLHPPT
jgi:hypothetical protein